MSAFNLEIACCNAAFEGDAAAEVARILRHVAAEIESGRTDGGIRDVNGNSVGGYGFEEENAP